MNEKMYYTTVGFLLTGCNLALIGTRFNVVGLIFGLIAMGFFIKAIRTKP